jgi:hypothetical protein
VSATAEAPRKDHVYRRTVTYCVVPRDLARLHEPLRQWFSHEPDIEVVIDRRDSDRRRADVVLPEGMDRRTSERRARPSESTAAALGMELPRVARRYADRLRLVARAVPVHHRDEAGDDRALTGALLAGDRRAADELRLRHHGHVHSQLAMIAGRRRAHDLTDDVFDAAIADVVAGEPRPFVEILGAETSAALARRHR